MLVLARYIISNLITIWSVWIATTVVEAVMPEAKVLPWLFYLLIALGLLALIGNMHCDPIKGKREVPLWIMFVAYATTTSAFLVLGGLLEVTLLPIFAVMTLTSIHLLAEWFGE